MKKDEKKEHFAIAVGFFMIFLVITITLIRNNPFAKDSSDSQEDNSVSKEEPVISKDMISAKDLQKKILLEKERSSFTLLDIRPFQDYAKEHIADTINIPLDEFPASSKIDSQNLIIIIGTNSADGDIKKAIEKLKEEKFGNILTLTDGMKGWSKIGGATVTYGDPKSFVDQSKVFYVEPEKLKDAFDKKVPMFIVDVRTSEEYSSGHIPGAKNVPFEELEKRRSEISEKKVIVVGINEVQEFQASVKLYDMLLASPYILKGAMPKWQEKGFPIEK